VGQNGQEKSTLAKIIVGELEASRKIKQCRIICSNSGYFAQKPSRVI